ncbi:hypothetical protein REPUB_Repub15cG0052800 [Reevesia pubescens]
MGKVSMREGISCPAFFLLNSSLFAFFLCSILRLRPIGAMSIPLVRIARIFNTYGPRMCIDDGRVVSNFVAQALRKEPLTVYSDGKQTRSFQYV